MSNCEFCNEPLDDGRHPLTDGGARDVTGCQVQYLLAKIERQAELIEAQNKALQLQRMALNKFVYEENHPERPSECDHTERVTQCAIGIDRVCRVCNLEVFARGM